MSSKNKYEKRYRQGHDVCGPPFAEIVGFFDRYTGHTLDVLDLGCGQGRDALPIARLGHRVTAVDIARSGIEQLLTVARQEDLTVVGVVADIIDYRPDGQYDVIVLDRVLHMLGSEADRLDLLARAAAHTRLGGAILIADTKRNLPLFERFFAERPAWRQIERRKGFLFVGKAEKKERP